MKYSNKLREIQYKKVQTKTRVSYSNINNMVAYSRKRAITNKKETFINSVGWEFEGKGLKFLKLSF